MPPKSASKKRKAPGAAATSSLAGNGAVADEGGGAATGSNAAVASLYPPLKPADGVALLRHDLVWDTLELIFKSTEFRFTPPSYNEGALALFPVDRTWSFAELYLDCICNSLKANRNLRDKMNDSKVFAVNFSKLCLLINAGRINTTLAFYPEMRTMMRTYHPIPVMQADEYTSKNLQDAPRTKTQLKGCHLPSEVNDMPTSLEAVLERGTTYQRKPPTCVVNCIFLLYQEWSTVSAKYFPEGFNLFDLLYPGQPNNCIPSEQRAHAFLWLVHRFLEQPDLVRQDFTSGLAKLPEAQLLALDRKDCSSEDVDTPEELEMAEQLLKARHAFIEKFKAEDQAQMQTTDGTPGPEDRRTRAVWLDKPSPSRQTTPKSATAPPAASSAVSNQSLQEEKPEEAALQLRDLPVTSTSGASPLSVKVERAGSTGLAAHAEEATTPTPGTFSTASYTESSSYLTHRPPRLRLEGAVSPHVARVKLLGSQKAQLVPLEQGIAEPQVRYEWNQFFQVHEPKPAPNRRKRLLEVSWHRMKRRAGAGRDPVYDSDDEGEWTAEELQSRLLGFQFVNYQTNTKNVIRYQGEGPNIPPDIFSQYVQSQHRAQSSEPSVHGSPGRERNSVTPT